MKLDMHCHTKYSPDSFLKLEVLKKHCKKLGIIPIITDHDEIKGNKKYGCPIVASEISSSEGHIIGYFLTAKIKKGLSAIETIEKIKEQGGLVCLPHPFDKLRKNSLNQYKLVKKADMIEAFNSRVIHKRYNWKALNIARIENKPITVGSDGHFKFEVGKSYIDIEPFNSPKEFMKNLKKAKYYVKSNPWFAFIGTVAYKKVAKK